MKPKTISLMRKVPLARRAYALLGELRYRYETLIFEKTRKTPMNGLTKIVFFENKFRIKLDLRDRYNWALYNKMIRGKNNEPAVTKLVEHFLKEGDIFVDIGANIGYYSLLAASIVKQRGKVYSFEPSPQTYFRLRENIALNSFSNIIPYRLAVSDKPSLIKLYIDKSSQDLNSRYRETDEFVTAHSYPLDKIIKDKANMIKIDCEGCEFEALRGMREILIRSEEVNRCTKIIIEFNPSFVSTDFFEYLVKYFTIYGIEENFEKRTNEIKKMDEVNSGNVLLIPKKQ